MQGTSPIGMIGGVRADAPLFNRASPAMLRDIVSLLGAASYSFADDSGKEWPQGGQYVRRAADIINYFELGFYAIQCLHRDKPQLVTLEMLLNSVLKQARQR